MVAIILDRTHVRAGSGDDLSYYLDGDYGI